MSEVHVSSSSLGLAVLGSGAGSKESTNRAPLGGQLLVWSDGTHGTMASNLHGVILPKDRQVNHH